MHILNGFMRCFLDPCVHVSQHKLFNVKYFHCDIRLNESVIAPSHDGSNVHYNKTSVIIICHEYVIVFFRGNHKVEDACEMYARAANMFKMAKNWSGTNDTLHLTLQLFYVLNTLRERLFCYIICSSKFSGVYIHQYFSFTSWA